MKKEIAKARDQYVVKANEMIRTTRYSLTLQQQKLILFAISKIRPHDDVATWYETSVREICEVCGFNDDGGSAYMSIKNDMKSLTRREFALFPDGHERTVAWLGDVDITLKDGKIRFQFHQFTAPLLFELKEKYTQYQLRNVLVFRSAHTIRLYEFIKSFIDERKLERQGVIIRQFTPSEIRIALGAEENYKLWADFQRFVLRPAIEELNKCCEEFEIGYGAIKEGREIKHLEFTIRKRALKNILSARLERRKRLDDGD